MSSKKIAARPKVFAAVVGAALLLASSRLRAAGRVREVFAEGFADVNGVRLRYLIGGKGSAVIMLHGYADTSHMWDPIMPLFAERHTVIVSDLRGAGRSSKPPSGYDKKNMAMDIHELISSLGLDRISIVGHDIGLMVAYAYASILSIDLHANSFFQCTNEGRV